MDFIKNKVNSAAGGGKSSEKNEDGLDKAVDYVQENVMGQGKQNNESAVEQAKDEQISVRWWTFMKGDLEDYTC